MKRATTKEQKNKPSPSSWWKLEKKIGWRRIKRVRRGGEGEKKKKRDLELYTRESAELTIRDKGKTQVKLLAAFSATRTLTCFELQTSV